MEKFLLIQTDGYVILHKVYSSYNEAYSQMRKEYVQQIPKEWIDGYKEYSFIDEMDARLFNNGFDVFVWKIVRIKGD